MHKSGEHVNGMAQIYYPGCCLGFTENIYLTEIRSAREPTRKKSHLPPTEGKCCLDQLQTLQYKTEACFRECIFSRVPSLQAVWTSVNNETSLLCYISLQQSYSLQRHLCELKNHVMFKGQSNMPSFKAKSEHVCWPSPRRGQWEVMSLCCHIHLLSPFYQPCSGWCWDDVKCGEGVLVYSGKVTG